MRYACLYYVKHICTSDDKILLLYKRVVQKSNKKFHSRSCIEYSTTWFVLLIIFSNVCTINPLFPHNFSEFGLFVLFSGIRIRIQRMALLTIISHFRHFCFNHLYLLCVVRLKGHPLAARTYTSHVQEWKDEKNVECKSAKENSPARDVHDDTLDAHPQRPEHSDFCGSYPPW